MFTMNRRKPARSQPGSSASRSAGRPRSVRLWGALVVALIVGLGTAAPASGPATAAPADAPAIDLVKTVDKPSFSAGETLTFTLKVTNSGNIPLYGTTILDRLAGASPLSCDQPLPADLAPGGMLTCTATYVTTQQDFDFGHIYTSATATGRFAVSGTNPPVFSTVSGDDEVVVLAAGREPGIDLVKTADKAAFAGVGDTISYTFVATNTGNLTLRLTSITDPLPGLSALSCDQAPPVSLAPGQVLTCTATYVVTRADVDAGRVENTATATGRYLDPTSSPPVGLPISDTDTVTVSAPAPGIDLVKTVDKASFTAPGETLTYGFEATNTGNVTLTDTAVSDALPGLSALSCNPHEPATLAPGQKLTCTATYVTTQADVDGGKIVNVANATGTPPVGPPVTTSDTRTVSGPGATPGIDLVKTADRSTFDAAGQAITYALVATNTGNVTLDDVQVDDALPGLSALSCEPTVPISLAPGASVQCTATYVTTDADLEAGEVVNAATAVGTPPDSPPVRDVDGVTVPSTAVLGTTTSIVSTTTVPPTTVPPATGPSQPVPPTTVAPDAPPSPQTALARTGLELRGYGWTALALIASGIGFVLVARRRRSLMDSPFTG